jgi:hypothetical protein
MLFSYAGRAFYIESCGIYRVVKEAMAGTLAKISVSALMFDCIVAQALTHFGHPWAPAKATVNLLAAGIAVLVTLYFWRRSTKGIHESSDDALKIIYVTTVMTHPTMQRLPPSPMPGHLAFSRYPVGWLPDIASGSLRQLAVRARRPPRRRRRNQRNPTSSVTSQAPKPSAMLALEIRVGFTRQAVVAPERETAHQAD